MNATANSEAWKQAIAEGLSYFWAHMHVGGDRIAFVGQCWEDGGFSTNDQGHPTRDSRGNTVAQFGVEKLDADCKVHQEQVAEWWG